MKVEDEKKIWNLFFFKTHLFLKVSNWRTFRVWTFGHFFGLFSLWSYFRVCSMDYVRWFLGFFFPYEGIFHFSLLFHFRLWKLCFFIIFHSFKASLILFYFKLFISQHFHVWELLWFWLVFSTFFLVSCFFLFFKGFFMFFWIF